MAAAIWPLFICGALEDGMLVLIVLESFSSSLIWSGGWGVVRPDGGIRRGLPRSPIGWNERSRFCSGDGDGLGGTGVGLVGVLGWVLSSRLLLCVEGGMIPVAIGVGGVESKVSLGVVCWIGDLGSRGDRCGSSSLFISNTNERWILNVLTMV